MSTEALTPVSNFTIRKWYGIASPAGAKLEIRGGPIPVTCPCGHAVIYRDGKDVPMETTPHPCGHPDHFTVFMHKEAARGVPGS